MTVNNEFPRPVPTNRISIFYGYLVCLIALGVALIGLNMIVSRLVDLSFASVGVGMPEEGGQEDALASFRTYKQQVLEQRANRIQELRDKFTQKGDSNDNATRPMSAAVQPLLQDALRIPTDEELRGEYAEVLARNHAMEPTLKRNLINNYRYGITRELLSALQLFFTGAILFILHWRWVQRRIDRGAPLASPPGAVPQTL